MRVNDIFAAENGEHIRILLCSEEQCYAVSCQHFRMPFLLSAHELKGMNSISDEEYTIFTIDDDISAAQRCERDRRFALMHLEKLPAMSHPSARPRWKLIASISIFQTKN